MKTKRKTKKPRKFSTELWTIVSPAPRFDMALRFGVTRAELWRSLEEEQFFGTLTSRKWLKAQGYRAVKVKVTAGLP